MNRSPLRSILSVIAPSQLESNTSAGIVRVLAVVLWIGITVFASGAAGAEARADPINAVIGDDSWTAEFGTLPSSATDEKMRIQVHLAFVLERLRDTDVEQLPAKQKRNRRRALGSLERYIERGVFPKRGHDSYPGRRPRFIDSAGTHCAVGHLIAASGDADLARSINAEFEYAYVSQITSPGLVQWASEFGFTATELAMIQPEYPRAPATEASMRSSLDKTNAARTLACAKMHPPAKEVRLRVISDTSGRVSVSSESTNPFTQCYARYASNLEPGAGPPGSNLNPFELAQGAQPFRFTTVLTIPVPQTLLEERIEAVYLGGRGTDCLPRPGPIPALATVYIRSDSADGLRVQVTTSPANDEVAACLQGYLHNRLGGFERGNWDLRVRTTRKLAPTMQVNQLWEELRGFAPRAASECRGMSILPPTHAKVTVVAKRDAEQFDVRVGSGSEAFRSCMNHTLQRLFRTRYSFGRRLKDNSSVLFFRIDDNATATHTFTIKTAPEGPR